MTREPLAGRNDAALLSKIASQEKHRGLDWKVFALLTPPLVLVLPAPLTFLIRLCYRSRCAIAPWYYIAKNRYDNSENPNWILTIKY